MVSTRFRTILLIPCCKRLIQNGKYREYPLLEEKRKEGSIEVPPFLKPRLFSIRADWPFVCSRQRAEGRHTVTEIERERENMEIDEGKKRDREEEGETE